MNLYFAKQVAILLVLGGLAASAHAGNLGPTSRGTISISITVPPHVMVKPASLSNGNEADAQDGLCIATNGFKDFKVRVFSGSSGEGETITLGPDQPRQYAGLASCRGAGRSLKIVEDRAAGDVRPIAGSANGPLTLLVVPD